MKFRTLFPHYNTGGANSHTVAGICGGMRSEGADVSLYVPASDSWAVSPIVRNAIPKALKSLAYKTPHAIDWILRWTEHRYSQGLRAGEIAYIWPGATLDLYRWLRGSGFTIVAERMNCHTNVARRILDQEFDRLRWAPDSQIHPKDIDSERLELELADYIYSPSPMVDSSLVAEGVSQNKILSCSYGWDPARLAFKDTPAEKDRPFTVVFVGYACVRKGIHLLLEAWKRAKLDGQLLIAGKIAPNIAEHYASDLNSNGVRCLGHVKDVAGLYRSADLMAFPTLEEGGPLVTYEAMACGLPVLVSPMGAGRIARNALDGSVLAPHDIDSWVEALRKFASDIEWRRQLGSNAQVRAQEFTWRKAGGHRLELLRDAMRNPGKSQPVAARDPRSYFTVTS